VHGGVAGRVDERMGEYPGEDVRECSRMPEDLRGCSRFRSCGRRDVRERRELGASPERKLSPVHDRFEPGDGPGYSQLKLSLTVLTMRTSVP
jgi:hypothetical protein